MRRTPLILLMFCLVPLIRLYAQQSVTIMFYNTENLFDTEDDPLKNDEDFTPQGSYHWTRTRYWNKLDAVSKVIAAVDEDMLPAIVGLCEVENDVVLNDLTARSALRDAGYKYVMTDSPDKRGIDVALLYRPHFFKMCQYESIRVDLTPYNGGATRDILHVTGVLESLDTLDIYVCHWPSRSGGVEQSEPRRICVAREVRKSVEEVFKARRKPYVIIMGDLNEGPTDEAVRNGLKSHRFAQGEDLNDRELVTIMDHVERDTYKYQGVWDTYDQFVVSSSLLNGYGCTNFIDAHVLYAPFLLMDDNSYGGEKPFRTYNGRSYQGGYSDHLPIVMEIGF